MKKIFLIIAALSIFSTAQTPKLAETVVIPSGAALSGYWGNSLNTSNPIGSTVFTNRKDGSQWMCFAEDNGASSPKLSIAHIVDGTVVNIAHGAVPNFSVAGLPSDQHNACSIALDNDGFLHLTYDQHASPLHYFKSVHPQDPYSWTGPLLMLGTNENIITFPLLFTNPANGEVYFTFQKGGGASADQYFYHYKTDTTSWEKAAGTGTGGAVTGYGGTLPVFLSGLPQWDKKTGYLWFNWQLGDDTTPFFGCGSPTHYGCGEYLIGWNGTSFIKFGGAAQTIPTTLVNLAPVYIINPAVEPNFTILDSVSVDANGTIFLPFADIDSNGILQVYVLESSSGSFVKHQLTSNMSVFSPPPETGWLGPGGIPGGHIQSMTAVSSGICTWVTYADIYNWASGQIAHKSCDNFHTFQSSYISARFNPNQIIFPDQVRNYLDGSISFLFMYSNDTQFRFKTMFSSTSPDIGKIWLMTVSPVGGNSVASGVSIRGGTSIK